MVAYEGSYNICVGICFCVCALSLCLCLLVGVCGGKIYAFNYVYAGKWQLVCMCLCPYRGHSVFSVCLPTVH